MHAMTPYTGPFVPPPVELLRGAIGWEFDKHRPEPGRWEPVGWQIVYPDGIRTYNFDGVCMRDRVLYSPVIP